ncbi:chorismate mutase [Streptococcaceae bacterium ESL0729]|nr:chorismate mutase [Streptococcaceae bacterium ESL0729]
MNLDEIRKQIDGVDLKIVQLLEERMKLVEKVVNYKIEHNMQVLDSSRENLVLEKVASRVDDEKYSATIVESFKDIMKNSRDFQNKHLNK